MHDSRDPFFAHDKPHPQPQKTKQKNKLRWGISDEVFFNHILGSFGFFLMYLRTCIALARMSWKDKCIETQTHDLWVSNWLMCLFLHIL